MEDPKLRLVMDYIAARTAQNAELESRKQAYLMTKAVGLANIEPRLKEERKQLKWCKKVGAKLDARTPPVEMESEEQQRHNHKVMQSVLTYNG